MVEIVFGTSTDVGHVREVNEDASLAAPPIFVVADGMGGHHGGDVASQIVVAEFGALAGTAHDPTSGAAAMADVLVECHRKVQGIGRGPGRVPGAPERHAGTTVAAAMLVDAPSGALWLLANLGDSRIYQFCDGVLDQVSVDHSLVQELLDAGAISPEMAEVHPERHVITRAVGGEHQPEADFFLLPVVAAPRLLLCSDGVSGMISADRIQRILGEHPDPRDAAESVVRASLAAGGRDNATAVVVDVVGLAEDGVEYDAARSRDSLEQKLGALP